MALSIFATVDEIAAAYESDGRASNDDWSSDARSADGGNAENSSPRKGTRRQQRGAISTGGYARPTQSSTRARSAQRTAGSGSGDGGSSPRGRDGRRAFDLHSCGRAGGYFGMPPPRDRRVSPSAGDGNTGGGRSGDSAAAGGTARATAGERLHRLARSSRARLAELRSAATAAAEAAAAASCPFRPNLTAHDSHYMSRPPLEERVAGTIARAESDAQRALERRRAEEARACPFRPQGPPEALRRAVALQRAAASVSASAPAAWATSAIGGRAVRAASAAAAGGSLHVLGLGPPPTAAAAAEASARLHASAALREAARRARSASAQSLRSGRSANNDGTTDDGGATDDGHRRRRGDRRAPLSRAEADAVVGRLDAWRGHRAAVVAALTAAAVRRERGLETAAAAAGCGRQYPRTGARARSGDGAVSAAAAAAEAAAAAGWAAGAAAAAAVAAADAAEARECVDIAALTARLLAPPEARRRVRTDDAAAAAASATDTNETAPEAAVRGTLLGGVSVCLADADRKQRYALLFRSFDVHGVGSVTFDAVMRQLRPEGDRNATDGSIKDALRPMCAKQAVITQSEFCGALARYEHRYGPQPWGRGGGHHHHHGGGGEGNGRQATQQGAVVDEAAAALAYVPAHAPTVHRDAFVAATRKQLGLAAPRRGRQSGAANERLYRDGLRAMRSKAEAPPAVEALPPDCTFQPYVPLARRSAAARYADPCRVVVALTPDDDAPRSPNETDIIVAIERALSATAVTAGDTADNTARGREPRRVV